VLDVHDKPAVITDEMLVDYMPPPLLAARLAASMRFFLP
jgi:hypothetical protein